MTYYLGLGFLMGLAAGLSPGPLLALVITETLQFGIKAGIKVAIAPIITDAPIVIVMFLVAARLSEFNQIVGLLSLIGGGYVLYIAYETVKSKETSTQFTEPTTKSLSKGVLTNALSPHPYLFWLTVGVPTIIKSLSANAVAPVFFVVGFYLPLVGSKVILACLIGKYRTLLNRSSYKNIMRVLALLLSIFAVLLFIDGMKLLGLHYIS